MNQSTSIIPESWDCHTHVLNPTRFPYRVDRKYTPDPAPIEALVQNATAQNIVIVQATPEDGEDGLIYHLGEAQKLYPDRRFRGTIVADTTSPSLDVRCFEPQKVDRLFRAGVRSIRVQGLYSSVGAETAAIQDYLETVATSFPIAQLGWSISMQLPLGVWAKLHDFLLNEESIAHITIIADHNGNARPEDINTPAFDSFLDLLQKRCNTYVKIGALHRRAPHDINEMKGIVQALASAAPTAILWGSDWPHVNTTKPTLESAPHIEEANAPAELEAIKTFLSEEQFHNMMVRNPAGLFH